MLSAPPPDPPQFPFAAVFAWLGDVLRDVVHAAKQSLARHGATHANDQHAAERTETIITPPAQRGDQPATRRGAGCIVVLAFGVAFISGFILRALGAFGPVPSIGTLAAGRIPTPIMESPGVVPTMTAFKPSNTPASAPPPTQVARPTATPIYAHRATPTPTATDTPTATVTAVPSVTITVTVTETPSVTPTDTPIEPTATPTTPTATPTATPTTPTATATDTPTDVATDTPTSASATATPTNTTQGRATATPTPTPTRTPRPTPTQTSTSPPSSTPSS